MHITISERLKPFSQLPGTLCPLPGTKFVAQVYPSKVILFDNTKAPMAAVREISIPIPCAMEKFTVLLDLERPSIVVWGWCGELYVRYRLLANETKDDLLLVQEKGELFPPTEKPPLPKVVFERLSLGSHKKQDWQLVKRRNNLMEILPHWFVLGQLSPFYEEKKGDSLLDSARQAIDSHMPDQGADALLNVFNAGCEGILVPCINDSLHQGFGLPVVNGEYPLALLSEGAQLIRSLFFTTKEKRATILPCLPTAFHCGRIVGLNWEGVGKVDIEWTKKQIRRLHFTPSIDTTVCFHFSKEMASYRLWRNTKDKGRRINCGESFEVKASNVYRLDRFEK